MWPFTRTPAVRLELVAKDGTVTRHPLPASPKAMRKAAEKLAAQHDYAEAAVLTAADGARTPVTLGPPGAPRVPPLDLAAFAHLHERGPQLRVLHDAVTRAAATGMQDRPHVLLHGPPGCGKTELLLAYAKFLGPKQTWHVDASTASKAGLEGELLRKAQSRSLPPFLVLEEVEKVTPRSLVALLAVMDARGTIQRTVGRKGDVSAECRPMVLATANDMKRLTKANGGALASRFALRLLCPPPSWDALEAILCARCNRPDWSRAVVNYQKATRQGPDARAALALLAGGERLLANGPGSFLADFQLCGG